MKKFSWTDLFIFIVSAEITGAFSALLSGGYTELYAELIRPPLSPPAIVFPVVWTILYAMMGISAYQIWRYDTLSSRRAIGIYAIQLAINFSWSIIFFRFEALFLAAAVAVLLFFAVGAMVYLFRRIDRKAANLQLPYLVWSFFAAYLAIGTSILN